MAKEDQKPTLEELIEQLKDEGLTEEKKLIEQVDQIVKKDNLSQLIPVQIPTDEEIEAIKEMNQAIEKGEWESWEKVKLELD